jgi:quercetin dioxygenase-like cupin family protein
MAAPSIIDKGSYSETHYATFDSSKSTRDTGDDIQDADHAEKTDAIVEDAKDSEKTEHTELTENPAFGNYVARSVPRGLYLNHRAQVLANKKYRHILAGVVGKDNVQHVAMSLERSATEPWRNSIATEMHPHTTQTITVEKGAITVTVDDASPCLLIPGNSIVIYPGSTHTVINSMPLSPAKIFTYYVPPIHTQDRS